VSKGTTHRSIRIDDGLWEEAKAATSENGDNISDIIRQALWQYIEDHTTKGDK
jgi:antitoxin component of RelBE/YafQ-DinJ toxin-antitoxin module